MLLKYIFNILYLVSMARTIKTGLIEISKKVSMGQFDGYIRS